MVTLKDTPQMVVSQACAMLKDVKVFRFIFIGFVQRAISCQSMVSGLVSTKSGVFAC